jgi:hypothetical protein
MLCSLPIWSARLMAWRRFPLHSEDGKSTRLLSMNVEVVWPTVFSSKMNQIEMGTLILHLFQEGLKSIPYLRLRKAYSLLALPEWARCRTLARQLDFNLGLNMIFTCLFAENWESSGGLVLRTGGIAADWLPVPLQPDLQGQWRWLSNCIWTSVRYFFLSFRRNRD